MSHSISRWPRPLAVIAIAFALLLAAVLGGCKPSDPAALVAEARQHRTKGDLRTAVIVLKNAIQKNGADRTARLLLGEVYLEQGDAPSAEKELRRARELGANAPGLQLLLGRAMLMQGQHERLLAEIGPTAAPAEPPALLALRANALLGSGDSAQAGALFAQALSLQPDLPDALLGMARMALAGKQDAEAATLIKRALAAHPDNVDCLRFHADLQRAAGKPAEALAAHQRILALQPYNVQALLDVANLHLDAGQFGPARQSIAAARKLAGASLPVVYAEAMADFREHKLNASLASLQQVLRVAPDYYPAILLAGAVQSGLGATGQAEGHLLKFLTAYPGDVYATKLMSALHVRANAPQAALDLLTPLLEKYPADVELLTLAGEANLRAHKFGPATGFFEQALALDPKATSLHTSLALSRLGSGDTGRAAAELERAAALDGGAPSTGVLLVMTHLRANNTDKALATILEMERRGDNPLVQNLKGGIYLAQRDAGLARASFDKALALEPLYLPALANLAQLDLIEGKPADARKRYEAALQKAPRNGALLEALAGLAQREGKPGDAVAWLERARNIEPEALPLALRLADMYARAGSKDKALRLARTLQSANPANPQAAETLARIYVLNNDLTAAIEAYGRLAALVPTSPTPLLRMANLHVEKQDDSAALALLRQSLAIEPTSFDAQITLINLLLRQQKFADARAVALDAQQRKPDSANGHKLEGDVHAAQGQYTAALAAWERAFVRKADGALLIQMHGALNKLGRAAEADARMVQWFKEHPADVPARLYYASSKLVANDHKGAIGQLEAILKADPDNIIALNDIAWACQQSGDARAQAFAERAHALAPGNPAVLDTLGWIDVERGNLARAVPLLRKANALAPAAGNIHFHLGTALARSGDKRAARRELERLLAQPQRSAHHEEATALLRTL
ncbi:XrtA/PEP-CTERM system TPR-repeat protein PrsT [Massilia sp. CCM 8734]|uniref:XrtA/PEP-CTERM system TPR-repeat protein PrsT n=1 Tax=Massilia sp. CCM 8734 TaxID=2609283 RepID=UPI001420AF30|nr:XrtA/PEP-CTERM system TPR-repeat protein PrsT [Massilia sp. CCM 8734]NHZ97953.1 PEP-CTERM system TPR-repeat protein PrsT [Massilia sp. CCM 8734]